MARKKRHVPETEAFTKIGHPLNSRKVKQVDVLLNGSHDKGIFCTR